MLKKTFTPLELKNYKSTGIRNHKFLTRFIFLILTITFGLLAFSFLKTEKVEAGIEHNVWGWAWSENIGWIKFNNCTDPTDPATCGSVNYGINIDPLTGIFSGYAWSENIGWITFNMEYLVGCPGGACEAKLNTSTMETSGWARACAVFQVGCSGALKPDSERGGWDGWIKLRGAIQTGGTYGVWLDTSVPGPTEFRDWAWGGDDVDEEAVIGWISFNCQEGGDCLTFDYKVITDFSLPPFPPDNLQEGWNPCAWGGFPQVAPGVVLTLSWDYTHPDNRPQAAYEIWISDSFGNFATATYFGSCASGSSDNQVLNLDDFGGWKTTQYDHSLEFPLFGYGFYWSYNYQWKIRVQDDQGYWSAWSSIKTTTLSTPSHAWPYPDFSWDPDPPRVGEITQFSDKSEAYGGATTTTWFWQFENGSPAISFDKNPTTTFTVVTTGNDVDLEVWDSPTNYHCPAHKDIDVSMPLPEYREVAPTSQLDNFLVRLGNIFARF